MNIKLESISFRGSKQTMHFEYIYISIYFYLSEKKENEFPIIFFFNIVFHLNE